MNHKDMLQRTGTNLAQRRKERKEHRARRFVPLRVFWAFVACLWLFILSFPLLPAYAQTNERCFAETGYCVSGTIYDYWQQEGGIPIFGYPLSDLHTETIGNWTGLTQWFERDRFEDHDAEGVKTGRLGAELLELQGRSWFTFSRVEHAPAGCRYFPETQHSLCEPFASYWLVSGAMELFGYPITEPFVETINGWTGTVQYFERRRLEYHTELPNSPVLMGLLGQEMARFMQSPSQSPPTLPNATPIAPSPSYGKTPFIPILMYHYIRDIDPKEDLAGYKLSVSPERFAAQLKWLLFQGYTTIRMGTAAACLRGEQECPPRAIALTFDDGYMDAKRVALPLLQSYGFVATFYIVNDFVGKEGYMGWDDLKVLLDSGMEIGAHSQTHSDLAKLSWDRAYEEIVFSKKELTERLGTTISSFCYPYGVSTPDVRSLVREAGYTNATTTAENWDQSNLSMLPRLRISNVLSQKQFEQLIRSYAP